MFETEAEIHEDADATGCVCRYRNDVKIGFTMGS